MKIGLVGASSQQRSLPFNAERTVNLFPVFDQQGKEVAALYGTPGLNLFSTAGTGSIRGCFSCANGRAFVVSAGQLYEILSDGTNTPRGTLSTSDGIVSLDENGFQLAICDGTSVYIFTFATNVFTQVSDVDLPVSSTITFIDGYFVVNKSSSGQFNISKQFDGLIWGALDFATAESSPDELIRVINAVGQLWLFGTFTTEVWTNTGDSVFPFQRISGAKLEVGILAPHTAVALDNSVFWVGRDRLGAGMVYRAKGFSPSKISTNAIDLRIQSAPTPETLRAYTYEEEGHVFYVLTGGGLDTTLVYDVSTDIWHERAYLNSEGNFEAHLGACGMYAFNKFLVGDKAGGNIYQMKLDIYSDNGNAILRERIYTHLSDEGKRIRYNALEIGFETGLGLQTGQGSNPQVSLLLSRDGAKTWSDKFTTSIGAVGNYMTKVVFRRLGIAEQMTFRIQISDPIRVAITGSYLT